MTKKQRKARKMQENNTLNSGSTPNPIPTQNDPTNNSPEMQEARKKKIIAAVVIIAVVVGIIVLVSVLLGDSTNGIDIVEEQLVTDPLYAIVGNNLYPIVVVKVKNTSNATKKVSFEANFYADGNPLGSGQASYITLAPGDESFLHAQSDKGYRAWSSHEYSYKITKWYVFE